MEKEPRFGSQDPDVRREHGRLVLPGLSDVPSRMEVEQLLAENPQWQIMRASVASAFEAILTYDEVKKVSERDRLFDEARAGGLPEKLIKDAYIEAIAGLDRPVTISDDLPATSPREKPTED